MSTPDQARIAILTPTFGATSETFITRHAQGLGATVITEALGPQAAAAGVEVIKIESPRPSTAEVIALTLRKGLRRLSGGDTHILPPRIEAAYAEAVQSVRPAVVLAEYGNHALHVQRACKEAGVPLVAHFHGYDLSSLYRHAGYRRALARFIPEAAGFVVVNAAQRERLLALGCPDEKIALIPYGVPIESFEASANAGAARCTFIAVGRLVPKKAPLKTMSGYIGMPPTQNTSLVMVGDGPLMKQVRELADGYWQFENGIIEIWGALPNDEVRRRMGGAQVFVQHSVTAPNGDEEGWPVAIAEAAACGLPVIATRHAGIPEEVIHGETGLLVEEGDVDSMAAAMATLAADPALRERMGKAARLHIEQCGNLKIQIEKLRDFLLERARPADR